MKKRIVFIPSLILSFAITPVLVTSCTTNQTKMIEQSKNKQEMFIQERTFSLRFTTDEPKDGAGFGTGWIFAKDRVDNLTYYIATNLHVAAFIQNGGKEAYQYLSDGNGGYKYTDKKETNLTFTNIEFGQFYNYGSNGLGEYNFTSETRYSEKLAITNNVKIVYETFDLFNNMQLPNVDNVYEDTIIKNATQDLAILKVNFAKLKNNNSQNMSVMNSLKKYNANPTKFAKEFNINKDLLTVGGYPYMENLGNTEWTINYNKKSSQLFKGIDFPRSQWKTSISETDNEIIKSDYELPINIAYHKNGYASMSNVSLQALVPGLDVPGGSSGSMAINQNNEVVGIYWGGYNTDDGNFLGGIDIFRNRKEYIEPSENNQSNEVLKLKPYDVIDDFLLKNLRAKI